MAIAAAAFAAGWHFGLFEAPATLPGTPRSAEQSPAAPAPEPAESAPAAAETKSEQAAAEATPPAAAPSFDIVRVEPDGAAVVAGRAAPNATVSLQSGTERLAEVKTDASGAFALDLTLPVGQHRLALNDGAQPAGSARSETAIVNVPEKGREGELLVMLERPGEASEILVKPEPETAAAKPAPAPVEQAAVALPAPSAAPSAAPAAPVSPPLADTASALAAAQPAGPLSVEAVEAEGGKLFVAGAAAERARVRVYLDDALVSETQGGPGDRFVASADAPVAVGDHVVRADQVDASGQVVARVEVPFNRPDTAPLAAIAPPAASAPSAAAPAPAAPSAEPAPAETELAAASAAPAAEAAPGNTTVQPALERVEARVIIRKGDTLWRISRSTYGRGSRFTVIYLANGDQIRDPNRIYPGQVFRVPDREG